MTTAKLTRLQKVLEENGYSIQESATATLAAAMELLMNFITAKTLAAILRDLLEEEGKMGFCYNSEEEDLTEIAAELMAAFD